MTGCQRPCNYLEYSFIGEKQQTAFVSDNYVFSLWAVSADTVSRVLSGRNSKRLWYFQNIFVDDLSISTIKMVIRQVVATEQLVYPWTSLVAEFGGCLGLFLGSSSSSGSSSSRVVVEVVSR